MPIGRPKDDAHKHYRDTGKHYRADRSHHVMICSYCFDQQLKALINGDVIQSDRIGIHSVTEVALLESQGKHRNDGSIDAC